METYATMRGRGWATREALDDAGERSNLVREGEMTGRMRWVRSYFVREDDDSLGPSGVSARKHGRARAPARGARCRLAWRGRTRPARGEAGWGRRGWPPTRSAARGRASSSPSARRRAARRLTGRSSQLRAFPRRAGRPRELRPGGSPPRGRASRARPAATPHRRGARAPTAAQPEAVRGRPRRLRPLPRPARRPADPREAPAACGDRPRRSLGTQIYAEGARTARESDTLAQRLGMDRCGG